MGQAGPGSQWALVAAGQESRGGKKVAFTLRNFPKFPASDLTGPGQGHV